MNADIAHRLESTVTVLKNVKTVIDSPDDNTNRFQCKLKSLLREFNKDLNHILRENGANCKPSPNENDQSLCSSSSDDSRSPSPRSVVSRAQKRRCISENGGDDVSYVKKCAVHLKKLDPDKPPNKHVSSKAGERLNKNRQLIIHNRRCHSTPFPKKFNSFQKSPATGIVRPFKRGSKNEHEDEKIVEALVHVCADVHVKANSPSLSASAVPENECTSLMTTPCSSTADEGAKDVSTCRSVSSLYMPISDIDEEIVPFPCEKNSSKGQDSVFETDDYNQYSKIRKKSSTNAFDFHSGTSATDDEIQNFFSRRKKSPFCKTSSTKKKQLTSAKKLIVPLRDVSELLEAVTEMRNYCSLNKNSPSSIKIPATEKTKKMITSLAKRCHFPIFESDNMGISLSKTRRSRVPSATDIEWVVIAK